MVNILRVQKSFFNSCFPVSQVDKIGCKWWYSTLFHIAVLYIASRVGLGSGNKLFKRRGRVDPTAQSDDVCSIGFTSLVTCLFMVAS